SFFLSPCSIHRYLHSFPTRRSSDLVRGQHAAQLRLLGGHAGGQQATDHALQLGRVEARRFSGKQGGQGSKKVRFVGYHHVTSYGQRPHGAQGEDSRPSVAISGASPTNIRVFRQRYCNHLSLLEVYWQTALTALRWANSIGQWGLGLP